VKKITVLLAAFYLVRHVFLADVESQIVRGEAGPFASMAECEKFKATIANQRGLECRPAVF
jgi:hypothetical protein